MAEQQAAHARALNAARGGAAVRSAQLAKTAQTLAKLGEQRDVKTDVEFYVAFFRDVRKHMKEAREAAEKQAEAGANEAAKKGTDAQAAAASSQGSARVP